MLSEAASTEHVHDEAQHSHDETQHAHTHPHPHTHTHPHKETKNVLNRMARIIGHMNSVKTMVETGRDCSEVLIQLSAVESAVRSLSRVILKDHISSCLVDAVQNNDEETLKNLNKAIDKFMK